MKLYLFRRYQDAVVKEARVAVTPELASARAKEMWERMLHGLAHRGVSREAYLRVAGRQESEILAELNRHYPIDGDSDYVGAAMRAPEPRLIEEVDDELRSAVARDARHLELPLSL